MHIGTLFLIRLSSLQQQTCVLITSHGLYWSNYTAHLPSNLYNHFCLYSYGLFCRSFVPFSHISWWNANRRIGYLCSRRLVVHILIRTGAFFRHLVCTAILCTTPEAIVILFPQILQNASQTLHGLARDRRLSCNGEKRTCAHIQTQELRSFFYCLRSPRCALRVIVLCKTFVVVKWDKHISLHLPAQSFLHRAISAQHWSDGLGQSFHKAGRE